MPCNLLRGNQRGLLVDAEDGKDPRPDPDVSSTPVESSALASSLGCDGPEVFDWRNADEGATCRTAMRAQSLEAVCITANKCVRAPGCGSSVLERPSRSRWGRGPHRRPRGNKTGRHGDHDSPLQTNRLGRLFRRGAESAPISLGSCLDNRDHPKGLRIPDDDKSSVLLPDSRLSVVERSCGVCFSDRAKSRAAQSAF